MTDDMPDPRMQRLRDPKGVKTEAWKQTLSDMDAIAEDRREEGWDVFTMMAAHTDTVSMDMRDHDEFGLFHIIPDNYADEFVEFYDDEAFCEYVAYGTNVEGYMYAVTELIDPEANRSVLVASRYDMTRANGMVESARKEGALYSHFKRVDGTKLAVFEHEEYEPLVRNPHRT